ncbi:hypothetical protein J1N35_044647 [Gossypium stocksii]|uniref:Uncharacterized protein n=1 Tax=Gossypium stocksii TaxID=47602 RepID=A0A9D3U9J2_9ROSI|nr:hypothetical protein J1N35_044647 [Gossypium stocksii]
MKIQMGKKMRPRKNMQPVLIGPEHYGFNDDASNNALNLDSRFRAYEPSHVRMLPEFHKDKEQQGYSGEGQSTEIMQVLKKPKAYEDNMFSAH